MGARPERIVVGLIALGVLIRLAFAATTDGNTFDINSYVLVEERLSRGDVLELYGPELHFAPLDVYRWPYPPGFFGFLLVLREVADVTGVAFERLVRLPSVAADALIAWLVFAGLGRDRRALVASALVALGPSFIAISGHHGQVDALAVAPAVAAAVLWERPGLRRRAVVCGLLVGLGAAVKSPIGLLVLAFLPTARSAREAATTFACAVAVPALALAPFLVADLSGVRDSLGYAGLPGVGGLSVLAQPDLPTFWLSGVDVQRSGLTDLLQDLNRVLVLIGAAGVGALMVRRRAPVAVAASAIVLATWVFGVNFALGYLVWGLPFLLLAGRLGLVALLQAVLLVPTLMIYLVHEVDGWPTGAVYAVYVPLVLAALAIWAVVLARLVAQPAASPRGTSPTTRAGAPTAIE